MKRPIKVTKTVSFNLYGETPKQAKHRLIQQRIMSIQKGRDRNVLYSAGVTKQQYIKRYNRLKKDGLLTKTPHFYDIYERR